MSIRADSTLPTVARLTRVTRGAAVAVLLAAGAPAAAQDAAGGAEALSLEAALARAEDASEAMRVARAGVTRARGELLRARSVGLPQVGAGLSYTRVLASGLDTLPGGGVLPFARENGWGFGVTVSQPVFTGGRGQAQGRIARTGRTRAEVELASQRAQLALDVTRAYFDAVLAGRLLEIAEETLARADTTLAQVREAHQARAVPEFDLLRAEVQRDIQLPAVAQRRTERDLAYLRLALLLDLSADTPLVLSTPLETTEVVPVARFADAAAAAGDTAAAARAPVRQAATRVEASEGALRVARSQRLPSLSLVSQLGRAAYHDGALPEWDELRGYWTVGAQLSVPLLTGGRIRGDRMVAEADLLEARARLRQSRDAARLDARGALAHLEAARSSHRASAGTVEQAFRAYALAQARYREGMGTQLELADSRSLLQQAQAIRAVAARDLQVAQARLVLLPHLPFTVEGEALGRLPREER